MPAKVLTFYLFFLLELKRFNFSKIFPSFKRFSVVVKCMPQINPIRLMLDTNIYGLFFEQNELEKVEQLIETKKLLIYGFAIIRKELRSIPSTIQHEEGNFRNKILQTYDRITYGHHYELNSLINQLALEYANELASQFQKEKYWNDFLIVACATLHELDILVSEDRRTMISPNAIKIYEKVNQQNQLRTPKFYSKKEMEQLL